MTYDPLARRVEKRVLRGRDVVRTTRFVWDRDNLVHEITREAAAQGDPVVEERTYCFHDASFEPLAHRIRSGADDPGRWLHHENDPAGTPERLVDDGGTTVSTLRHAPWGGAAVEGHAWARTPLRFQGQYEDAETGLRYNRHRYYDPEASRFISADPIGLPVNPAPHIHVNGAHVFVPPGYRPPAGSTVITSAGPTVL